MLLLSLAMSLAWTWLVVEVRRTAGKIAALAVAAVALVPWLLYGLNQSLTEGLALPLACASAASLLHGLRRGADEWLALCAVLMIWAEQFRPANLALVAVPLLLMLRGRRARASAMVFGTLLMLPVPWLLVRWKSSQQGLVESGQGGNGWATVYGFVNGNRPWMAAESVPGYLTATTESQRWAAVRAAAIEAFKAHPQDALRSLLENMYALATNSWLVASRGTAFVVAISVLSVMYWWRFGKTCLRSPDRLLTLVTLFATVTTMAVWAVILPARSESLRVMSTAIPTLAATHIAVFGTRTAREHPSAPTRWKTRMTRLTPLVATLVAALLVLAPWATTNMSTLPHCSAGTFAYGPSIQQVRASDIRLVINTSTLGAIRQLQTRTDAWFVQAVTVSDSRKVTSVDLLLRRPLPATGSCVVPDAWTSPVLGFAPAREVG